ncbi:GTP cyclohydrolase II RibA [Nocardia sp. NPDC003345]
MTAADGAAEPDTGHRFTRNGQDTPVRIQAVDGDPALGHLLIFGEPGDNCLVRIHSRCLYGEALGSEDCDCGPELRKSLDLIQAEGAGILVYLEQEGRGAGLIAKALGYREAERSGADTFTAYTTLGYPADGRAYDHAARSLARLGLGKVRLLTNNPDKVQALVDEKLDVTPEPLYTSPLSARAAAYLDAKRRHRGHWIPVADPADTHRRLPLPG